MNQVAPKKLRTTDSPGAAKSAEVSLLPGAASGGLCAFSQPLSRDTLDNDAWIGDAVLLLYARDRILREQGSLDNAACVRMTSNQFLASLGEPTRVEAEIGRLYKESGWAAAVQWIETWLIPLFAKQEQNRHRKGSL